MAGVVRPATAVIVTYQSARAIGETLAAARRCYDEQLLDCVIVDNGSRDGTQEVIQGAANWARIVLTGKNNGFGKGCNIGLQHVTSPFTVFINPDAVLEPEALRTMLRFMEQTPRAGFAGPATVQQKKQGGTTLQVTSQWKSWSQCAYETTCSSSWEESSRKFECALLRACRRSMNSEIAGKCAYAL